MARRALGQVAMVGWFLAAAAAAAWAQSSPAGRTFIVDSNSPQAADENPGTEDKPFRTVSRAVRAARAGDTVLVMEGTYPERVVVSIAATADRPVVLRSVPPQAARLYGLDANGASYLRVEGFRFSPADPKVKRAAVEFGDASHVEFVGNRIDHNYMGLRGAGADVRIAYNHVYHTQYGMLSGKDSRAWRIENNRIERLFWYIAGDCDYSRMWGKDHLVRANRYHGTIRAEVGKAHLDCVQTFNVKKDNPGQGLQNFTFEDNVCSQFSQCFMLSTSTPGTVHHITVRRNIIAPKMGGDAGGSWGLCLEAVENLTAENNTLVHIGLYGIGYRHGSKDGVVGGNLYCGIPNPLAGTSVRCSGNLAWQSKLDRKGADANGFLLSDPKLADPNAGNFRLTKGSPAIGAGADGRAIGALEWPNVYHVDARHPAADDAGLGYAGWPYKTLGAALKAAQPGETIVVRGGVYRETLKPLCDSVTIRAAAGEAVVISGADLIEGWRRTDKGWAATLANRPATLLRDGKPWTDFAYTDYSSRTATNLIILTSAGDPRMHVWETAVRKEAIDLAGRSGVKVEGIQSRDTLTEK
ncbi:MAG TPA: DUF1565 domain-containing protein [Phycisphaerae bacterium]|nr:DUF1565 domain-containing protein [Phycisphaerae bacterium]HUT59831.1 DUF1565 domain-containing protein [Phycisphaerae bacterium]